MGRNPTRLPLTSKKRFDQICATAVTFVADSERKVSPRALKNHLAGLYEIDTGEARRIVGHLVSSGELSYTYEYGSSFLEASYNRPVRVSRRLVLLPAAWKESMPEKMIPLRVQAGAAFGCGRHPTTRLALRGLETALLRIENCRNAGHMTSALDIGTGSGILAVAAVKLGIDRAVGIDRDACARVEAQSNARLNKVETRIVITDTPLSRFSPAQPFTVIMANLRTPTLMSLRLAIAGLLAPDGGIVLSGIKSSEKPGIQQAYAESGFRACWSEMEKGWAGIVLRTGYRKVDRTDA